ncbi:YbdD/YjiX family protein [Cryobacterium sp. Y62]|uniref:YbdD/YjiX family protein n=1 Tax=Cryobacterium sp. Y62 TaxID=2048284 RepID=UPI000CE506D8|nr:YbdD/YjiX family protein [Cryobacterium sp. Y62]
MTVLAGVRKGARGVIWYLKGVLGEDAYEKYVAHHAACCETDAADFDGAQHPLMTAREFWRDQTDRQDQNPQRRCC